MLSASEIIVILFVVVLLFGPKKIPEIARGLGKGMKEFKKATDDIKKEINNEIQDVKKNTSDEIENLKKFSDIEKTLKND